MFLYLIRLHVPLVVARSPFIRSPVHKIILFVPTFLGSALLLALNMARLTVQQILAYRFRREDYARLNKSLTSEYRRVQKLWKQLGPANAQSLRKKRQAAMLAAKRTLLEALAQRGALRQTAEAAAAPAAAAPSAAVDLKRPAAAVAAAPTAASKKVARRPAARRR